MRIISNQCVNSNWVADFLAGDDQECCECFGSCKVKVINRHGYIYILNRDEIERLREREGEDQP